MPSSKSNQGRSACAGFALVALVTGFAGLGFETAQAQQGTAPPAARGPEPTCAGDGQVWWAELLTDDLGTATTFYSSVLGWTSKSGDIRDMKLPPRTASDRYVVFSAEGSEAAGMMRNDHPNAVRSTKGWVVYFQVRDLDRSIALAKSAGGSVLVAPFETSEGNRMALVEDPTGAVFGLVKPSKSEPC